MILFQFLKRVSLVTFTSLSLRPSVPIIFHFSLWPVTALRALKANGRFATAISDWGLSGPLGFFFYFLSTFLAELLYFLFHSYVI